MSGPRLFVDQPVTAGDRITLEGQAAHHVAHVLRMRSGSALNVFDGTGHEYHAIIADIGRSRITLDIGAAVPGDRESTLRITLAQGIARHERMDMILQKAVELGVQTIQPLWLQRSQGHLKEERLEKRLQHWRGILISACEQCGRSTLPQLRLPGTLPEWLSSRPRDGLRLMMQPDSSDTLSALASPSGDIVLLVGPEGGMNPHEQSLAGAAGFTGVRLGPRILRTETAALAAIAAIQVLWGDFR